MATLLTKNVSRETLAVTDHPGRKQIVTLEAGDMISFRGIGKRSTYSVSIQAVYFLALINEVNMAHKKRLKEYNQKRKAGIRCRKPKPMPRIFSQQNYEALRIK